MTQFKLRTEEREEIKINFKLAIITDLIPSDWWIFFNHAVSMVALGQEMVREKKNISSRSGKS